MRHPYTRALFAASAHRPPRVARLARAPLLEVDGMVREYRVAAAPVPFAGDAARRRRGELRVGAGESVGLVGESGCGKSTLARAVLGLEPMQGGSVAIEGEAVSAGERMPRAFRAKMQVVFQDPYGSFNPRHRVARLVAEPFHLLDAAPEGDARRAAVEKALADVGLGPRTPKSTSTSSPAASGSVSPSPAR